LEKVALIVAGGAGTRMGTDVPKQFLLLKGIPVLMYTLEVFHRYDRNMRIILVLPGEQKDAWQKLCRDYRFTIGHEIREGGRTRFHSVKKNLSVIPDPSLVAVHDGVRPLVSLETIERCFRYAQEHGNAIPCVEIPETLRFIDGKDNRQADRALYRLVQTPQVFESSVLKKAYRHKYRQEFTDDAGVVESLGYTINLVEGNPENIKITFKKDMLIAASLVNAGLL